MTIAPRMPAGLYRAAFGLYVPRLCVDVVVHDPDLGILLQKRDIAPLWWHIPGGIVRRGEYIDDAARRHAREALNGLEIGIVRIIGVVECLNCPMEVDGAPIEMHNVMAELLVNPLDDNRWRMPESCQWFEKLPPEPYDEAQIEFLVEKGYLK